MEVKNKSILINAANLHVGGGLQVATSVLIELNRNPTVMDGFLVTIYASSEVHDNLENLGVNFRDTPFKYIVIDLHGIRSLKYKYWKIFSKFDAVFSIFGPIYHILPIKRHFVGFAQAWIIYPNNECYRKLPFFRRAAERARYLFQWIFFKRADHFFVELGHVKRALMDGRGIADEMITVVENAPSPIFNSTPDSLSRRLTRIKRNNKIRLATVSRGYVHKNIDFLGKLANELEILAPGRFEIITTLTEDEMSKNDLYNVNTLINIGPVGPEDCIKLYNDVDGVVFPSLLESFSATPIEAMIMRIPLFASDRPFVRECCGDFAEYIDPLSPFSTGRRIVEWYSEENILANFEKVERAYSYTSSRPNSSDRFLSYIRTIREVIDT